VGTYAVSPSLAKYKDCMSPSTRTCVFVLFLAAEVLCVFLYSIASLHGH